MCLRTFPFAVYLTAVLATGAGPASGESAPIRGRPTSITDADTLRFGSIRIRLEGIDGPELSTSSGPEARLQLVSFAADRVLSCYPTGARSYRRIVAVCRDERGRDIAGEMVDAGWAWDWPRFSGGRYRLAEIRARFARRGMFAHAPFAQRPDHHPRRGNS